MINFWSLIYKQGKLGYAQDAELRHVAIKAIFEDSEEHRILRYLHEQSLDMLQENCILPVLDILPYGRRNLCFVVMPRLFCLRPDYTVLFIDRYARWGKILHHPESFTTLEVLDIIQSMLKVSPPTLFFPSSVTYYLPL